MNHLPERPTGNDPQEWRKYWEKLGYSWRTEPEIDFKRQTYLDQLCTKPSEAINTIMVPPYTIPPFKDVKLSRADVEWLLMKKSESLKFHENIPDADVADDELPYDDENEEFDDVYYYFPISTCCLD